MNTHVLSLIIGVIASSIASLFFIAWLHRLVPKIEIAPYISKRRHKDGTIYYRIKIMNRGRRAALEFRGELFVMERRGKPQPFDTAIDRLTIYRLPFDIAKYDKNDTEYKYEFRMRIMEDIETLWPEGDRFFLRIRITCRDSFSNFSKVFRMDYRDKTHSIKYGQFYDGASLEVDPNA